MSSGSRTHMAAAIPTPAALTWLRNAGIVLAGSALLAACAHVTLPLYFTPVPLTLQPFAVLLLALLLPPTLAFSTMAAYLLEGASGLPVFAPGSIAVTGIAHLIGPTGGYLLAYPFAGMLISRLWRQGPRTLARAVFSAAAGDLLILGLGAVWLSVLTHASISAVLSQAVIPFLPGEGLKVAVAAAMAFEWQRMRRPHAMNHPTV